MKNFITAVALLFAMQWGIAQDSDFKKDVLKFIEVSNMSDQQINLMEKQLKMVVPSNKFDEMMAEVKQLLPKLNDKIADEMMKIYTHDEIKQLTKFYQSSLGQTMIKKQNEMMPIMYQLGEQWGREDLTPIVMKYVNK